MPGLANQPQHKQQQQHQQLRQCKAGLLSSVKYHACDPSCVPASSWRAVSPMSGTRLPGTESCLHHTAIPAKQRSRLDDCPGLSFVPYPAAGSTVSQWQPTNCSAPGGVLTHQPNDAGHCHRRRQRPCVQPTRLPAAALVVCCVPIASPRPHASAAPATAVLPPALQHSALSVLILRAVADSMTAAVTATRAVALLNIS
jgi:hypothetical protein